MIRSNVKNCIKIIRSKLKAIPFPILLLFCPFLFAFFFYLIGFVILDQPIPNFINKNKAVSITGDFPFSKEWDLVFTVKYKSTNPDCLYYPTIFGIRWSSSLTERKAQATYRPIVEAGGSSFSINIPDNEFIGPCVWRPYAFGLRLKNQNGENMTLIEPSGSAKFPPPRDIEYFCIHRFKKFHDAENIDKESVVCKKKEGGDESEALGRTEASNETIVTFTMEK